MAEFQFYSKTPGFRPRAVVDTAGQVRERVSKELEQLREFQRQNRIVDQQRIEDTKYVGQNLKAAAQFSKSAFEQFGTILKDDYESRQINEYVDSITGAKEEQAEAATIARGDADNSVVGPAVQQLNEEGDSVSANLLSDQNRIGRGVAKERALLQDSKGYLLSRVTAILSDPDIMFDLGGGPASVIDLKADPNNAAALTKLALRMAIKERGLEYTTKRAFKEILGGTIDQIMTNTPSTLTSKAISDKQAEDKITLTQNATSWGFSSRGKSLTDMQSAFNEIQKNSLSLNTGEGRGATNRLIVQSYITGLKDPDDIRRAAGVKLQNGATIGGTFPLYFETAIKEAEAGVAADNKVKAQKQAEDGIKELQQMKADGKSIQEIESRSDSLAAQIGAVDSATGSAFTGRADTLVLNTMKEAKFEELRTNILGGKTYSPQELIDSNLDSSYITRLQSLQKDEETVNLVKPLITEQDKLLKNATFKGGGIKLDPYSQTLIEKGWVDPQTLTNALRTFTEERAEHLRNYAATLRGKDPDKQRELMTAELRRWDQDQLYGDNGAFKALGLINKAGNELTTFEQKEKDALRDQLRTFASPNATYKVEGTRGLPVDYTTQWNPGGAIPEMLRKSYIDRGGVTSNVQFMTLTEVEEAKKEYAATGIVPVNVVTAGESLGISGLDFLNQQSQAYALDTIKPVSTTSKQSTYFGDLKPGPDLTGNQRRSLYLKTAGALVAKGMSQNAATGLSRAFTAIPLDQWDSQIDNMLKDPVLGKALRDSTKTPKQIIRLYNTYLRATGQ